MRKANLSTRRWSLVAAALGAFGVVGLAACEGDPVGPSPAAGEYVLEAVSGRGPIDGTIVLSSSGRATRSVRFQVADGGTSREYLAVGSFRVADGGAVDLRLREDGGVSEYEWRPHTTLADGLLQLRHPDPADGPDIVESYRRR